MCDLSGLSAKKNPLEKIMQTHKIADFTRNKIIAIENSEGIMENNGESSTSSDDVNFPNDFLTSEW